MRVAERRADKLYTDGYDFKVKDFRDVYLDMSIVVVILECLIRWWIV